MCIKNRANSAKKSSDNVKKQIELTDKMYYNNL